ncbi:DMT family transporter [Roseovarius aestuarii]|uniref:EamA-like transporter family protein n=1 Tax=Roseovarius aestuarii TaxID=475083 RepID=A0A1X7BTL0_9RHOB|nr:DMT family transporter [Roseovarius aestuarii]SMC12840.1 EamA-like transporter family protein [Roseovarius aestuarii]
MDLSIVFLVLASATLHPIWNLLVKKNSDPQLGFILLMATTALCALAHGVIVGVDFSSVFTVLPVIALSVIGQMIYGTCLTATLQRGDLSTYYPIIRASPIFVVIASVLLFGTYYSPLALLGIGMVMLGGFLLQYRRGSRFFDDPFTLFLAVLAMCGTGIYSLADAHLSQRIAPQVLMFTVDILVLPFYLILWRRKRANVTLRIERLQWLSLISIMLPGLICYVSYYLILVAYQLGGDVAVVTALRQASIPISVALGGLYLREGAMGRRFAAATLLAFGIVVISMYG